MPPKRKKNKNNGKKGKNDANKEKQGVSGSGGEKEATTIETLQKRLKEILLSAPAVIQSNDAVTHPTGPVAAQPNDSEVEVMVDDCLLVMAVKPKREEGADAKKSEFNQGHKVKCSQCHN